MIRFSQNASRLNACTEQTLFRSIERLKEAVSSQPSARGERGAQVLRHKPAKGVAALTTIAMVRLAALSERPVSVARNHCHAPRRKVNRVVKEAPRGHHWRGTSGNGDTAAALAFKVRRPASSVLCGCWSVQSLSCVAHAGAHMLQHVDAKAVLIGTQAQLVVTRIDLWRGATVDAIFQPPAVRRRIRANWVVATFMDSWARRAASRIGRMHIRPTARHERRLIKVTPAERRLDNDRRRLEQHCQWRSDDPYEPHKRLLGAQTRG